MNNREDYIEALVESSDRDFDKNNRHFCPNCNKTVDEKYEINETLEDGSPAHFYSYCKECGDYLYTFTYGHYEY